MLPAGLAEIDQAKADGRWAAAYSGQAEAAGSGGYRGRIVGQPCCGEILADLNGANRYAVLYRIETTKRAETCVSSDRSIRRDAGSWRNDPSPATRATENARSSSTEPIGSRSAASDRHSVAAPSAHRGSLGARRCARCCE